MTAPGRGPVFCRGVMNDEKCMLKEVIEDDVLFRIAPTHSCCDAGELLRRSLAKLLPAIREVVAFYWDDEQRDFDGVSAGERVNHIFTHLEVLRAFVESAE